MELSAGSHGLPGRGRGSGISAARHWVSHPTGGWNYAAAVVFSRGPRNLPDRGRVPGNGRSGDRDADAKEAENLLSPRAGQGLLEVRSTLHGNRIARVIFCIAQGRMVLLHGFVKKTKKIPNEDLTLARRRMKEIEQ